MEITSTQLNLIENLLPLQRGNVKLSNLEVLNAIFYVAEHGCKWRNLPDKFGNWHSIYTRANRWAKNGVLDRVFLALQEKNIIRLELEHLPQNSVTVSNMSNSNMNNASINTQINTKKTILNLSVSYEDMGPPKFTWLRPIETKQ